MPALDSRRGLIEAGFQGFAKLVFLQEAFHKQVPKVAGLFAIVRESDSPPEFLELPQARALPPNAWRVDTEHLRNRWVPDSSVLYLGAAGPDHRDHSLRDAISRLDWPSIHQTSALTHHGQLIWYLRGSQELEAAWCTEPSLSLEEALAAFAESHGRVPFGNASAA